MDSDSRPVWARSTRVMNEEANHSISRRLRIDYARMHPGVSLPPRGHRGHSGVIYTINKLFGGQNNAQSSFGGPRIGGLLAGQSLDIVEKTSNSAHGSQPRSPSAATYDTVIDLDGTNTPTPTSTSTRWDMNKSRLKDLYLTQNRTLGDTMKIMREQYHFIASEKQCKTQFRRWGWKKYNTKSLREDSSNGHHAERPSGKRTCTRPARLQRTRLSGYNESRLVASRRPLSRTSIRSSSTPEYDRVAEDLLFGLRDLIRRNCVLNTTWSKSSKFTWLPTTGEHLLSLFTLAARLLNIGKCYQSGLMLRRAFVSIENIIKEDDIKIFQSLLFDIPFDLIASARSVELRMYLKYLFKIFSAQRPGLPITRMAGAMYQLSLGDPQVLFYHIQRLHDLNADEYLDIRGHNDFNSICARVMALTMRGDHKSMNPQSYKDAVDRFDALQLDAINQYGENSPQAAGIEFRRVQAISRMDPMPAEFMTLCETFLHGFVVEDDHLMFILTTCDHWVLEQYAVTKYLMHEYLVQSGYILSAIRCVTESMEAFECAEVISLDEEMEMYHAGRALRTRTKLAELLEASGRLDEANAVTASLSESRYLQGVERYLADLNKRDA